MIRLALRFCVAGAILASPTLALAQPRCQTINNPEARLRCYDDGGRPSGPSPTKILLGPHLGDATIVSLERVNSDRAVVTFRRELDDEIEMCAREHPDYNPSQLAACANAGMRHRPTLVRRGYCSGNTLYTEFGSYSLVGHERETASNFGEKLYRPIRTDWKDHRTEQVVGNCSACNTPQLLSTFRVLCPKRYDELFAEGDPH